MRVLLLATLVALGLGAAGCGGSSRYVAQGTAASPGVDAEIEVGKTEGSQLVDLDVEHLTDPARLTPGASGYAVWIVPEGQQPIFAGMLSYDEGSRRGRLRATTPYERFDVLVTAEPQPVGQWPSGALVLTQRVP